MAVNVHHCLQRSTVTYSGFRYKTNHANGLINNDGLNVRNEYQRPISQPSIATHRSEVTYQPLLPVYEIVNTIAVAYENPPELVRYMKKRLIKNTANGSNSGR